MRPNSEGDKAPKCTGAGASGFFEMTVGCSSKMPGGGSAPLRRSNDEPPDGDSDTVRESPDAFAPGEACGTSSRRDPESVIVESSQCAARNSKANDRRPPDRYRRASPISIDVAKD